MIRLSFSVDLRYDVLAGGADFLFNVQPAVTRQQHVVQEHLSINQPVHMRMHTDPVSRTRFLRIKAGAGPLTLHSTAVVELSHHIADGAALTEVPVDKLPDSVLPFLFPSRYCESDRLQAMAMAQFGALPKGYARVMAVRDWVHRHVTFRSASSNSTTSACDTLTSQAGVCRDFAHVMIALCRALNLPARFTTGFDYGADPTLGPPDFHAYVEVYVGGRWYLFDPSGTAIPMAFVRLACGRDASDAAFASIFGPVNCQVPVIQIQPVPNASGRTVLPQHTGKALSTDSGED